MVNKECSKCQTKFACQIPTTNACWCTSYPPLLSPNSDQDCLCPSCLGQVVSDRIDTELKLKNRKEIIHFASQYRQEGELIHHLDYTIENGNYVFTKWFHLKRGSCCGNGCRNCPYSKIS